MRVSYRKSQRRTSTGPELSWTGLTREEMGDVSLCPDRGAASRLKERQWWEQGRTVMIMFDGSR